jgi:hypothetical protein
MLHNFKSSHRLPPWLPKSIQHVRFIYHLFKFACSCNQIAFGFPLPLILENWYDKKIISSIYSLGGSKSLVTLTLWWKSQNSWLILKWIINRSKMFSSNVGRADNRGKSLEIVVVVIWSAKSWKSEQLKPSVY